MNGGRPITKFNLAFDVDTYDWGHKIGFCKCGEPLLLRTQDTVAIARFFGENAQKYFKGMEKMITDQEPKLSVTGRVAKWCLNNLNEKERAAVELGYRSG